MNFREKLEKGGGSTQIQKISLQIFGKRGGGPLFEKFCCRFQYLPKKSATQFSENRVGWGSEAVWKFSENSSNLVQVYAPYLHEGQGCRKVLILYTRLEHLLLISTISTFLSENTNTLMTEEEATGFVGKENIGTWNELVQSITSCDSQPFYLNTTCLAPVNHHDFGLNHMGWSGVVTVLQIKKILQTLREDIRRKKTFSFGHCPNHLNPPP